MNQRGSIVLYLVLALAILGMLAGIGYKVRQAGYDAAKLECEQAAAAQREREAKQAAEAATGLETKREKAKIIYKTITERVNVEVEKPVYRNVCFTDDGMRIANAALAGTIPGSAKPNAALPDANAALRGDRGGGAAKDR